MSEVLFEVITPGGVLYKENVNKLTIRTLEGYITVLPNHFPLVTNIVSSICDFNVEDKNIRAFTGRGILKVGEKDIKLIVSSFNFKDEIDIERARRALDRANAYLSSTDPNVDKERALRAKIRAEARIALWEGK